MEGKNCLDIRNQQEKSYQNDELFFLGFEKVQKMQASVICQALELSGGHNDYCKFRCTALD